MCIAFPTKANAFVTNYFLFPVNYRLPDSNYHLSGPEAIVSIAVFVVSGTYRGSNWAKSGQYRPNWVKISFLQTGIITFALFGLARRTAAGYRKWSCTKQKTMARKMKALIDFTRKKEDGLVVAANTIIGAMTDNPHYVTPMPALEDVQALVDDFSNKLIAARRRGSPEETALKDEAKPLLVDALHQLAYYVNLVAKGHLSTLLSSGFPVSSPDGPSTVPYAIEYVRLTDGYQSGQVRLDFAKQDGIRIYEYQYRNVTLTELEWSDRLATTSSRGNILAPLEPGQRYEVRVRAVNTQGAGDWSQIASIWAR
ncbi:fibronectin type III domain-containing protein [Sphingobacterium sp. SGG-5]|uniref:fibronectin type III domain-containing protein n=1 Tax=Sphingobacterium sp. SGG-5 TaxID=2710881 RepID=UPI0013EC200E|nr:fibronectin type III domain-containing protein [Sphingobacterium sp. SGG-5]NGM61953.1 fibronectin type III domain-containing protein [Sphingobacterium sp. SGG-5]